MPSQASSPILPLSTGTPEQSSLLSLSIMNDHKNPHTPVRYVDTSVHTTAFHAVNSPTPDEAWLTLTAVAETGITHSVDSRTD